MWQGCRQLATFAELQWPATDTRSRPGHEIDERARRTWTRPRKKFNDPPKGETPVSGDGAPSYKSGRSRLCPATCLTFWRVIEKILSGAGAATELGRGETVMPVEQCAEAPQRVNPTSKQISLTGRLEMVSSSLARSSRSRVRKACGVSPKASRNVRRKCHSDRSASTDRSDNVNSSPRRSRIKSRTRQSFRKVRDDAMVAPRTSRLQLPTRGYPFSRSESIVGQDPEIIRLGPPGPSPGGIRTPRPARRRSPPAPGPGGRVR
jgi:hypothetical protein